jgi:hypothetical protein
MSSRFDKLGRIVHILSVVAAVLLVCIPAFSQVNLGRILGVVTDQQGAVIVGATVTVIDVARGVSHPLTSDSAGEYAASSLVPGTYTVRAEAKGFQTLERQNITVGVGQDARVDLTLQPGVQTQTVTVTEALPIVNTTNAQLGGDLEAQTIGDIPINGRLYTKLLEFNPGVILKTGGKSPQFSANGAYAGAQEWLLDGLEDTNAWTSQTGPLAGTNTSTDELSILPLDAIQEVNVVENPKAEYGWRQGAQVNVGLKSGTNDIHGSAFGFIRNAAMDANNPFNVGDNPIDPNQALPKAKDNYGQYGGSIGGPIKKNKLFYFGSYEGQHFAVGAPTPVTIPTSITGLGDGTSLPDSIAALNAAHVTLSKLSLNLAGCTAAGTCTPSQGVFQNGTSNPNVIEPFPNTGASDNQITKIDYHVNDHHSINGEYYLGNSHSDSTDGIHQFWEDYNFDRVQIAQGLWVWTPNSAWVNEARFGYDRYHNINGIAECVPSQSGFTGPNYASAFGFVSGVTGQAPYQCPNAFPLVTITGFSNLGAADGQNVLFGTYSGTDSVSYTRGKHIFKVGAEFHDTRFFGYGLSNGTTGAVTFGNPLPAGANNPLDEFLMGLPVSGSVLAGNENRSVNVTRFAIYGQDDWRITPRVSANLGLRYEIQPAVTEGNNQWGNFNANTTTGLVQQTGGNAVYKTDTLDLGPRAGIVWDVTGKGTTVVRLGGSIVYNDAPELQTIMAPQAAFLSAIPTGLPLFNSAGVNVNSPAVGNIALGTLTPLSFPWVCNNTSTSCPGAPATVTPVFSTNPGQLACGNGVVVPTGFTKAPAPCSIQPKDPNYKAPYVSNWTLAVQRAFTNNLSLNVAYVGSHGTDLPLLYDINEPAPGPSGAATEQPERPLYGKFPFFSTIKLYGQGSYSNYNALEVTLVQRVDHGLSFTAGYTYAHALSINESDVSGVPLSSANPKLDYGNNANTPFQHFSLTATYAIPGRSGFGQMLEGWTINSNVSVVGSFAINPADTSSDLSGTGDGERWTLVGKPSDISIGGAGTIPCYGVTDASTPKLNSRFFNQGCTGKAVGAGFSGSSLNGSNAAAFVANMPTACVNAAQNEAVNAAMNLATPGSSSGLLSLAKYGCYMVGSTVMVPPAQGTFGTMSRNELRDKPIPNWDLSILKNFKFHERYTAEVRVEFFNILNITEYALPFTNPFSPVTFGLSQGTPNYNNPINGNGGPRTLQLGLKFLF